jgi:perosamine synthetase
MMRLLPFELWDYRLDDLFACLASTLRSSERSPMFHLPGLGDCIPARSARAALVTAIKALELPPGAQIGVPLYCCPVVFKAIALAGCRCRFIDIERETYCMSAEDLHAKRRQIEAVIAVHMFGNMCDMDSLIDAADGRPIIEDCAQALGSRIAGRPAGSFGSIAAFSFRSGKYLSVGEGGAIFTSDPTLRARSAEHVAALPVPTRFDELVHMGATYARSTLRRRPFFGLLGYPLWSAYNSVVQFADKSPIVLGQMYSSDFFLAKRRLAALDAAITRQRANAAYFDQTLHLGSAMLCLERPGFFHNRYVYPILFTSSVQRDSIADHLHRMDIDTSRPYRDIADIAASYYGYAGDCPIAEQAAAGVLAIPSYHSLKESDAERIAECVNTAWRKVEAHAKACI